MHVTAIAAVAPLVLSPTSWFHVHQITRVREFLQLLNSKKATSRRYVSIVDPWIPESINNSMYRLQHCYKGKSSDSLRPSNY